MARDWRSRARDPWANDSMADALRVVRAARYPDAPAGTLAETTSALMERLGFTDPVDMLHWAQTVRGARLAQAEAQRREQELQAHLSGLDWPS